MTHVKIVTNRVKLYNLGNENKLFFKIWIVLSERKARIVIGL
jgi:hypothetical protein